MIKELRSLQRLGPGIDKKWIWSSTIDYKKSRCLLRKIDFTITDLNREIPCLGKALPKEVVYTIVLVDWIREAQNALFECCRSVIKKSFVYEKEAEYKKANKFFTAIRSFSVAHPANTTRHEEYGFDGSFLCEDMLSLKNHVPFLLYGENSCKALDMDGLHDKEKKETDDVIMYAYKVGNTETPFARPITFKIQDIYHVAELYIDRLYALDRYLAKQKKKDYEAII